MSWSYSYTSDIWPALLTLAVAVYLFCYSWPRRNIPAARPFNIACIFGVFWTLGVILELLATDFSTKVFWLKFQAIWQLPLAATIACFVFKYAGWDRWLNRRNYTLLFLIPILSILFIVTNNFHHLIWSGFQMDRYVIASPGRLYWFFNSYVYLLGVLNLVALVRLAIYSPGHRLPVAIIVFCQIISRIGYMLYKLQAIGPGESMLLMIGVMELAYAFALFRYNAIDPVAAARKAILHQMREGLLVLDMEGRIIDVNPIGVTILGLPGISLRQKLLVEVMPIDAGLLSQLRNKSISQTDIILGEGDSARQYNLNLTPLIGRDGVVIGQLLLLHDVTEQKRTQTQIIEQQKVVAMLQEREYLARELHDGIGQILGYVSLQAQTAIKWVRDGKKEKAESLLGRIVEISKDAHADVRESILSLRGGSDKNWSLIPTLKKYIDRFQANYGIRTELSISDGIGDNTFDPTAEVQLLRVIQEAMTNCRKHSGTHFLKVGVELDGSKVYITISDDGNGFDAGQFEPGDSGHFGLVFMRERMEHIGGALKIDSLPGGGTILKLDVPIRKELEESK
jgi:signal transduction histidine kinase